MDTAPHAGRRIGAQRERLLSQANRHVGRMLDRILIGAVLLIILVLIGVQASRAG